MVLLALVSSIVVFWAGDTPQMSESERGGEPEPTVAPGPDRAEARSRAKRRAAVKGADARAIALRPVPVRPPVRHTFGSQPRAGVMFDVDSGEVLWEHRIDRESKIASLTKMMTAHLISKRHSSDERVPISKDAVGVGGSMIGLLPAGKKVPLAALLKGLLLVSGNDAAVALAEYDAGSVGKFVSKMNAEAKRLGLDCTRFSTPHGLSDVGNYSCPRDLAAMARLVLGDPKLAKITSSKGARTDFPIAGGKLELANNNPFIRAGDETVTGVKTGFTEAAGRSYVMASKRGGRHIGVVLLDSPDPLNQVPKLWKLGFGAKG